MDNIKRREGGKWQTFITRNPLKGFCIILTLHTRLLPACSPTRHASLSRPLRWGSQAAYDRARRLLPPQVGVLGGVRPSAPVAAPSVGVLGGVLVVSPFLGTGPPSSLLGTFLGPRI